jgi:hypothetical protein
LLPFSSCIVPSVDWPDAEWGEHQLLQVIRCSGAALTTSVLSGWTPHTSERRDFWHRLRAFPREVVAWRKRMLRYLADQPDRFPAAAAVAAPGDVQERLDTGIRLLREIARMLAVLYGTPDLGNKTDPTDEQVYIMSSRKTPERAPHGSATHVAVDTISYTIYHVDGY